MHHSASLVHHIKYASGGRLGALASAAASAAAAAAAAVWAKPEPACGSSNWHCDVMGSAHTHPPGPIWRPVTRLPGKQGGTAACCAVHAWPPPTAYAAFSRHPGPVPHNSPLPALPCIAADTPQPRPRLPEPPRKHPHPLTSSTCAPPRPPLSALRPQLPLVSYAGCRHMAEAGCPDTANPKRV